MYLSIAGKYNENNISNLVRKINFIFPQKGNYMKNCTVNMQIEAPDFTAIAALVLYKFFSYAIDEKCLREPQANVEFVTNLFSKFHLHDLMAAYLRNKDIEKIYPKIKPVIRNDFFIAPHPISRTDFKDINEIETKYYKTIKDYYSVKNRTVIDCIKTCLVEISSNFYYHATDNKSILMAEGSDKNVDIISVDTSEGIIATMRKKYNDKLDTEILKKAFKRRVSSKMDQGHCGTGLWLVNELVTKLKGKLILHTGGYLYRNIQGKITTFDSSYWQGTILYVRLPINDDMDTILKELLTNEKNYI